MAKKRKQYQIVNASQNPVKEIDIDGRTVTLDKQGSAYVTDTGLGEEIDARYGHRAKTETAGKVVVIPVDDSDPQREKGFATYHRVPDLTRFKRRKEN